MIHGLNKLDRFSNCRTGRLYISWANGSDATAALFFYDYCLTVSDEARYVWRGGRMTIGRAAFFIARYGAMAGTILVILPDSGAPAVDGASTVIRLISIVASELIVAIRTWAIWCRSRFILITLAVFSVAAIIPATVIIGESIVSNRVIPLVTPEFVKICSITISNISQGFIVPYILTILYEFVTLSLSLIRIINWRRTIPEHVRAPIIDTLWRDGVLYFSFMLILGFVNIGIVLQSEVPQARTGCAQLQAVVHSILSTRIVLHLRDIETPGCSVYQTETRTAIEFAGRSRFTSVTITRADGYGEDEMC
ncbi:hypothetical protein GYMLUDRAFT_738073 [Collybiopsis luxurians FD-317 M1]|uniref:DUF6533 domain-containing protein n=1 Tax=Collybiopsis luxurians FD-317 M1 TaxID=944289 RepID=A0A0D0CR04_9AGAR|nr:hypothetical protein GYMLUDRAFT_738073 [Collybiopsis luxurians FD-317 M1]